MKTAIYLEDGVRQIVLTPETEFEKKCCDMLCGSKPSDWSKPNFYRADLIRGKFSDCQRHYIRQYDERGDLIIRLHEEKPDEKSNGTN